MGHGFYEPSMYRSHSDFGVFLAGILFTLLLAAVILGVAALMRRNNPTNTNSTEDLTEVVKRRYANGEINKQEYEQLLADLTPTKTK